MLLLKQQLHVVLFLYAVVGLGLCFVATQFDFNVNLLNPIYLFCFVKMSNDVGQCGYFKNCIEYS